MRVISPDLSDLSDRIDVTVDPTAETVDLDDSVAEFFVSFFRSTSDASRSEDRNSPEAQEGRT